MSISDLIGGMNQATFLLHDFSIILPHFVMDFYDGQHGSIPGVSSFLQHHGFPHTSTYIPFSPRNVCCVWICKY